MDRDARIYVAGHAGLVGSAIVRRLEADGYTNILTATRHQLDLRDQAEVSHWFKANRPAYVFLVAEALIDAGVLAGLARPVAEALVVQLLTGSAALLADRGDPASLRAMVPSPGGTTAAGLRALEDHGVRAAFLDAVIAATERSRELGR